MPESHDLKDRLLLLEMAERMAGIGHWRFDLASGSIAWSDETFRIHGVPKVAGEPGYEELLQLYHPDDRNVLAGLVERAIATGEGYDLDARILRPDGELRYVSAKADCIRDDEGRIESLCGVFQDVTERTRAERSMRVLTDHIPGMVAYWDRDLRCGFANARHMAWFGRAPEEMLGMSIRELMGEDLFALNEPFIRQALEGKGQVFERTLTSASGEVGHTWAQYIPDVDAKGRVQGFYVLITDVTPLKQSEQRLAQTNIMLRAARDQAEAATVAKSEFLSNMSHELRSPLTSIVGFSELLVKRDVLRGAEQGYLARIQEASTLLLATVNDILDFSKLDAGQVEIDRRAMDPGDLGLRALELFEPQLTKKGLSSRFEAVDLPARVQADDTRIRQILINLLSNAVKFTAAGGVHVKAAYDPSRGRLRYEVSDTGPGIAEHLQSKLFQRFSQVDASTTRAFGGTGLGLAICKGLVEAMGGVMGVESAVGEGSCFWLEIPSEIAESGQQDDDLAGDETDAAGGLQGLRLLVADDNPANRELARLICDVFGVVVMEAEGGAEAIRLAQSQAFDIVLMDIRMPGIDGPQAARVIRSGSGPNESTPIIAFTADVVSQLPPEWEGLFDDLLAKPIVAADLLGLLTRYDPGLSHTPPLTAAGRSEPALADSSRSG